LVNAKVDWGSLEKPEFVGVHNINIAVLGADTSQSCVPCAGARYIGDDSIEVVLNPVPDHGAVVLHGQIRNNTVAGRWQVTAYALGDTGVFRMTRQ